MADERKRVDGYLFAWQLSEFLFQFSGKRSDVNAINPYRGPENPTVSDIKERIEKKRFWSQMQYGLFGKKVFE